MLNYIYRYPTQDLRLNNLDFWVRQVYIYQPIGPSYLFSVVVIKQNDVGKLKILLELFVINMHEIFHLRSKDYRKSR